MRVGNEKAARIDDEGRAHRSSLSVPLESDEVHGGRDALRRGLKIGLRPERRENGKGCEDRRGRDEHRPPGSPLRFDHEQRIAPESDLVTGTEFLPSDPNTVQERAVGRVEIAERPGPAVQNELGMVAARVGLARVVREHDVIVAAAPDTECGSGESKKLSSTETGDESQLHVTLGDLIFSTQRRKEKAWLFT